MLDKIMRDFKNLKRDRYNYETRLANQFELGFQALVLGANKTFSPRFRGFSQGEEDFLLYAISRLLDLSNFLEFGVEDWRESNTRILSYLINGDFTVWDGSSRNIDFIRKSREFFLSHVHAETCWITRENISAKIGAAENSLGRPFDVISIDIDGNDYWVLEKIGQQPKVFICEYNSLFGEFLSVSSPYKDNFVRRQHHDSGCIYGASHSAFKHLMENRGYQLFHTTLKGNNLFFLRNDIVDDVKKVFVGCPNFKQIRFRELFKQGMRTSTSFDEASRLVLERSDLYVTV